VALRATAGGSGGGTITGVTAGTGLTGGGSSGTVTVNIGTAIAVTKTAVDTYSMALAANTSGDGLILSDPTLASAANQQWSPRLHLTGQGWATTPVASQPVDWIVEVQPIQGAANPTSQIIFSSSINGGAYTQQLVITSAGVGNTTGIHQAGGFRVQGATVPANGTYLPAANTLGFSTNGILGGSFDPNHNFINLFARADQSKSVQVPTTGFTITIANNTSTLILNPAGTLATGTITMPATPIDGQEVQITSSQTITALTVSPNASQTISNAPTTMTAGLGNKFIYHLAGTNWYRLY
jgi:hypothetical protein